MGGKQNQVNFNCVIHIIYKYNIKQLSQYHKAFYVQ